MNFESINCWYTSICDKKCPTNGCSRYIQMKWQMENCGLPEAQQQIIKLRPEQEDVDVFQYLADIKLNIDESVKDGVNLYIASKHTGNGKTSWAIKLLQSYLSANALGNYENLQGMFIRVSDLLLSLKDFQNPVSAKYKENLKNVDLVVWDDIAITGISQYDYIQLFNYIDYRILANKANIYTSNCETRKELSDTIGEKLASRIWDRADVVLFKGKDRR